MYSSDQKLERLQILQLNINKSINILQNLLNNIHFTKYNFLLLIEP